MSRKSENTPRIAILKRATRDAIEAVGGLDLAAGETRAGRSQLGRCQSPNEGDTVSLRDVLTLDELSIGRGGPFILPALARVLNHAVVDLPGGAAPTGDLFAAVVKMAAELGDVSRKIVEGLSDGNFCKRDAEGALDEVHQLNQLIACLRVQLIAIRDGEVRG